MAAWVRRWHHWWRLLSEVSCFSHRNSNRNSDWNSWLIPLASDFLPNYSRILNNISSADKQIKLDGHEIPIEKAAGCGYLMSKSSYVNVDKIWWSYRWVNFEMSFWCLQTDQKINKIFVRISSLASKKRSNVKSSVWGSK